MNAATIALWVMGSEEPPHVDDDGYITTHHWLWPEKAEIIYGGLASVVIFSGLYFFAWPILKKGLAGRTERIQNELDAAANAINEAEAEAAEIRAAKGDIGAERTRRLAEAEAQAEALLADGRQRIAAEIAELETKGEADIRAGAERLGSELRAEIARLSALATESVVADALDPATQHDLVESFIAKVGAGQ